jgi:nucleotide-binding universal stress UspA family protein
MSQTLIDDRPTRHAASRKRTGPLVVAAGNEVPPEVLRAAKALAPAFGGRVHVLSVLEPLPIAILESEPILVPIDFEEGRLASRTEQMTALLRDVAGPKHDWKLQVLHGEPVSTLAQRARSLDAALILMGIGRHRPIDRLLGAETTLRTIRHASCPVLAIAAELDHLPHEVVVATDFSPQSALAAEAVMPLLDARATLHFVHVWEPSASSNASMLAAEERYGASLPARFDHFVGALTVPAGVTVTFDALEGKIAERLLEYAGTCHADVIVAGRHGLKVIARLFIGSVTSALIRGATCAVLVTPEPTFADVDRFQRLLIGTSASRSSDEWQQQLESFTRRNQGRCTSLEVDDPAIGAQTQETGYALTGASCDPHTARVELMLGRLGAGAPHLTRSISDVDSVDVLTDLTGYDTGLRIKHGRGQTLLTFLPEP